MQEFPEHIDLMLNRLFDGTLSEADRAILARLASEDADLKASIVAIERLSTTIPPLPRSGVETTSIPEVDAVRLDRAWRIVAERAGINIDTALTPATRPKATIHVLLPRLGLVAAVVLMGVMVWMWLGGSGQAQWQEVVTARGQMATVSLPDGSSVRLNAASTLRYRIGPDAPVREVSLEGEALFDVVPGASPFEVVSSETRVRVLGTRFAVRSRDGTTRVAVQEGRVSVGEESSATILTRLEAIQVALGSEPVRLNPQYAEAADDWAEGLLSYQQTPFLDVVRDIEVRFDMTIRVDGQWADEATLSGSFPGQDAEQVLTAICSTFGCTVSPAPGATGFVISR